MAGSVIAHCGVCGVGGKAEHEHVKKATTLTAVTAEMAQEVYPLDKCPVSGEKLGSMGDPHVMDLDGITVKLCCDRCVGEATANKDTLKDTLAVPEIELVLGKKLGLKILMNEEEMAHRISLIRHKG